mgnify:CR=1 FL=1
MGHRLMCDHKHFLSIIKRSFRIVLPLARPAIIVTCVMVLITVWNEYLFATTFLLDSQS